MKSYGRAAHADVEIIGNVNTPGIPLNPSQVVNRHQMVDTAVRQLNFFKFLPDIFMERDHYTPIK